MQEKIGLGAKKLPNIGNKIDIDKLKALLPAAIEKTKEWMTSKWEFFEDDINKKLKTIKDAKKLAMLKTEKKELIESIKLVTNHKKTVKKRFAEHVKKSGYVPPKFKKT